jgi:hypothetical protein
VACVDGSAGAAGDPDDGRLLLAGAAIQLWSRSSSWS